MSEIHGAHNQSEGTPIPSPEIQDPVIQYNVSLSDLNPQGLKVGDVVVIGTTQGDRKLEVCYDVVPGESLVVWTKSIGDHRQRVIVNNPIIRASNGNTVEWLTLSTPAGGSSEHIMVERILVQPAEKSKK